MIHNILSGVIPDASLQCQTQKMDLTRQDEDILFDSEHDFELSQMMMEYENNQVKN